MKSMIDNTARFLLVLSTLFLFIIAGGLPDAEASDAKVTFTVQ